MNTAASPVVLLFVFEEDACSVALAEQEVVRARPAVVSVSVQELIPGERPPVGDPPRLRQAQADLVSGAADATAETGDRGLSWLAVIFERG